MTFGVSTLAVDIPGMKNNGPKVSNTQIPFLNRDIDDHKQAAFLKYNMLTSDAFGLCDEYWMLGHAFDTMIDFVSSLSEGDLDIDFLAQLAIDRFHVTRGFWYDDYGWWGIASLRASEEPQFAKYHSIFRSMAISCWLAMDRDAPRVWERGSEVRYNFCTPKSLIVPS